VSDKLVQLLLQQLAADAHHLRDEWFELALEEGLVARLVVLGRVHCGPRVKPVGRAEGPGVRYWMISL